MSEGAPLVAFLGSLLGCWAWLRIARQRVIDIPGTRSLHTRPTPTSGGIGILAGVLLAAVALRLDGMLDEVWCLALLLASGLSLLGLADDRRGLPVRWRLAAQLLAAGVFLAALWPEMSVTGIPVLLLLIGGLVWVVGFTNLFNFMDGIDGLAATQAAFAGAGAAVLSGWQGGSDATVFLLASLAAAALGFLRWNWPPARLFMGDAGSLLLGFLFAVGGILCTVRRELSGVIWIILWAPFLVDGGLTLLRRALGGEALTSAHRDHAYQRYALRCGSHRPVTLAVLALDGLWLLPLAFLARQFPAWELPILASALLPVLLVFLRSPAPDRPR